MIQVKELRLGNVLWNGVVVKIAEDHFIFNDGIQDWDSRNIIADSIKPKEITGEILIKCGFSSPVNGWYTSPNGTLEFGFNGPGILILMDWFLEITSLHQLQNLYFAMTNKELEINL